MPEAAAEYGMIRGYLDWLVDLPWAVLSPERIDIAEARRILDEDHYGLEKVKRRILEYLAVRKLNPDGKSPILCFVGPPGVGKTSLGQSIARTTGRKFTRLSLGGVHDEAESAVTAAPISAPCPATSSSRSARPARETPC
jgi:ATP-dependent Lon protease